MNEKLYIELRDSKYDFINKSEDKEIEFIKQYKIIKFISSMDDGSKLRGYDRKTTLMFISKKIEDIRDDMENIINLLKENKVRYRIRMIKFEIILEEH